MSLAEKLYRIGECVSDGELRELIKEEPVIDDSVSVAFINFYFKDEKLEYEPIKSIAGINPKDFFFTKAIGGRGKSYYYLYPNLILENFKNIKDEIDKKIVQFVNTLENAIEKNYLVDEKQINTVNTIIDFLERESFDELKNISGKKVLFAILFEKQTFLKAFPEILENYLKNPVFDFYEIKKKTVKKQEIKTKILFSRSGFDMLNNTETKVGFNPNVKVFTMDNYHDDYKSRIVDTLELSKDSAKYINRGWLYAIEYLMFYYKGLSYLIIPNFVKKDENKYKIILNTFKTANEELRKINTEIKKVDESITQIAKQEKDIEENIKEVQNDEKKLEKKPNKRKNKKPSLLLDIEDNKHEEEMLQIKSKLKNLYDEKNRLDIEKTDYETQKITLQSQIKDELLDELEDVVLKMEKVELKKQKGEPELLAKDEFLDELEDTISKAETKEFLNAISLDLLFVDYDAKYGTVTNIYGTIQDIIPSKISDVKQKMRNFGIEDGIRLKGREKSKVYLQDYFSRFELLAKFSKTINEKNVQNMEFKERIYLAKLLLSEEQISYDNLLNRFEQNREFNYEGKKRIGKDGVKEWLNYPEIFLESEQRVIEFLKSINSLKE